MKNIIQVVLINFHKAYFLNYFMRQYLINLQKFLMTYLVNFKQLFPLVMHQILIL